MPKEEMDKLVAGLEALPHVAVMSDEIYSPALRRREAHFPPLLPVIRDRTILLDGWGKTYAMTGWRMGFGVWPRSLVAHAERLQYQYRLVHERRRADGRQGSPRRPARLRRDHAPLRRAPQDHRGRAQLDPRFSCILPGAFYAFANVKGTGIPSRGSRRRSLRSRRLLPLRHELRRVRRRLPALQLRQQRRQHSRGHQADCDPAQGLNS